MGRELFPSTNTGTKNQHSVSPQKDQSSNSNADQVAVKYFLPIRMIAQLRRVISLLEAEKVQRKKG